MDTIDSTAPRKHFYALMKKINNESRPILVTDKNSGNVVMVSESGWNAIQETLYLESVPGYMDSVKEAERDEQDLDEMETLDLNASWAKTVEEIPDEIMTKLAMPKKGGNSVSSFSRLPATHSELWSVCSRVLVRDA